MADARFKIGSKIYTTASLDEVSLRDLMLFNTQAEEMGLSSRWNDVERIAGEIDALTEEQAELHPDKLLLVGVTVWVSRRMAGEQVTFSEAVDVPIKSIVFLPPTEDRKPGPTKPRKGAKKTGSAPVADPSDEEPSTTPPTSPEPSDSD